MQQTLKAQLDAWCKKHGYTNLYAQQDKKQGRQEGDFKKVLQQAEEEQKKRATKMADTQMSVRDIKELMGVGRPTYRKHKGSYRQRG